MLQMWKFGLECWKARNNCIYGNTNEAQDNLLHREMDGIIASLYDNKKIFHPRDTLFLLPAPVRTKHHTIKQKFYGLRRPK